MPHPTDAVVVRHPITEQFVPLDPAINYDPADILVRTYPWAFVERATSAPGEVVESVAIEVATAEPGQKRTRTRSK